MNNAFLLICSFFSIIIFFISMYIGSWLLGHDLDFKKNYVKLLFFYSFLSISFYILFSAPPTSFFKIHILMHFLFLISVFTDMYEGVVFTFVSLLMALSGIIVSALGYGQITLVASLIGSIGGYSFCRIINFLWNYFTQREPLGLGDAEFCAGLGAWIGGLKLIASFSLASLIGSVYGIGLILLTSQKLKTAVVPLIPFLYIGYVLSTLILYFYPNYVVIESF